MQRYCLTAKDGKFYVGLYTRNVVDGVVVEGVEIAPIPDNSGDWLRAAVAQRVKALNKEQALAA